MTSSEQPADQSARSRVERLLTAGLEEVDAFLDGALERLCAEHPEQAAAIRDAIATGDPNVVTSLTRDESADQDAPFSRIGPYQPTKELGRGGQGVVYLAEDTRLGRTVALKVLKGFGPLSEQLMQRFKREAEVTSRLDHPGICRVYDAGMADGIPFIAMQFLRGKTLADTISEAKASDRDEPSIASFIEFDTSEAIAAALDDVNEADRADEPAPTAPKADIPLIISIIEQAARAMHVAHEAGIVHRDIKPGNIMVTPTGQPVLLDFGLAGEEANELSLTQTGDIFGTPAYMSPEQLAAKITRPDRRSDVFSLAVTLFECVTLRRPFEAPTRQGLYEAIQYHHPLDARKVNAHVSTDLATVIEKALEKDRDERYPTALAFADELQCVRELKPINARRITPLGRLARWAKRRPARATLVVLLAVGIPVLAALGSYIVAKQPEIARAEEQALVDRIERHVQAGYTSLASEYGAPALEAFDAALALRPNPEAILGKALAFTFANRHEDCLAFLETAEVGTEEAWAFDQLRAICRNALSGRAPPTARMKRRPSTPLGYFMAGQVFMQHGRRRAHRPSFRRALDYFTRAAMMAPHARPLYHAALGYAAGHLRDKSPVQKLAGLMQLWPDSAEMANWYGHAARDVDPNAAIAALEKAIRLDPEHVPAHHNLAYVLQRTGKSEEAIAAYQKSLAIRPYPLAHANLGTLLLRTRNDLDGALAELGKAVTLDPNYATGHANLGAALIAKGRVDNAIASCKRALQLNQFEALAHANLGRALAKKGDFEAATEACRRAIELRPDEWFVYGAMAEVSYMHDRLDDAIANYEKLIERRPSADAYRDYGATLQKKGRLKDAVTALEKALAITPDSLDLKKRLASAVDAHGTALFQKRKHKAAAAAYERALSLAPTANMHYNLANVRMRQGKTKAAIEGFERAIKLDPSEAEFYVNLGSLLFNKKRDFKGAERAFREALELDPKHGNAHLNLGNALYGQRKLTEAIASYQTAIKLNPNDARYYRFMMNAYAASGRPKGAIPFLESLIEGRPDLRLARVQLATFHLISGNLDTALEQSMQLVKAFPKHGESFRSLGNVRFAREEIDEAKAAFERAIALGDRIARTGLRNTEKMLKVRAVLAGNIDSIDAAELLDLSRFLRQRREHARAATIATRAMETLELNASSEIKYLTRVYDAACSSLQALKGSRANGPTDEQRTQWRHQSVRWLTTLTDVWSQKLAAGKAKPKSVAKTLRKWKRDWKLRPIRDEEAIAKLTTVEQRACRELWAAVEALHKKAKGSQ